MKKGSAVIILLILLAFVAGVVFFKFSNPQKKISSQNKVTITSGSVSPTEKSEASSSPTITSSVKKEEVDDSTIDSKIKSLDTDATEVDKSFSDTAIDVMAE